MAIFNQYHPAGSQSAQAGVYQRASSQFPSPWLDPASTELPTSIEEVFKFCELLWYSNGTYQQALNRVAAYFVTRIKISDVGSEEEDRWHNFLENKFHINKFMVGTGRNFLAYGNVLLSPKVTVNRILRCENCGQLAPIAQWRYRFQNGRFRTASKGCPKCKKSTSLSRKDFRPLTSDAVDIRVWNPHTMKIKYNPITERLIYRHILEKKTAELIRKGDRDMLEDTPWEFVQAALKRQPLRLHNDRLFHLKDEPLAGINSMGMGIPRGMANFRQAFLSQVLQRLNIVLGMEYSVPLRSVTPEPGQSQALDPTMGVDMATVTNKLSALIADWKRDPAAIHHFPIPIKYTAWGGEGLNMASHQIAEQVQSQLLTGLGIPVDFFVGSFKSERTFVPTLRLMERTWEELVSSYDATLSWIGDTFSDLLRWKKPTLTMEPVTTADDIELRNILLDLYMNGRISGSTAFETLKLDPVDENKKMIQEQVEMQSDADTEQAKMDQGMEGLNAVSSTFQSQGGQAPGGGQGGGGGGGQGGSMSNTPRRPDEVMAQAEQTATQLLSMDEASRRRELQNLKTGDPLLHGAVTQELKSQRSHRGSDVGQAEQAQQAQAG